MGKGEGEGDMYRLSTYSSSDCVQCFTSISSFNRLLGWQYSLLPIWKKGLRELFLDSHPGLPRARGRDDFDRAPDSRPLITQSQGSPSSKPLQVHFPFQVQLTGFPAR